jgi:hypothetical protein
MKSILISLLSGWFAFASLQVYSQEIEVKTLAEIKKDDLEKLKTVRNSMAFSLQYGHFELFPFAKTNGNSNNTIKIEDYHKLFNLLGEYYPYEHIAAQLSVGLMVIPIEKKIDGISSGLNGIQVNGSGKGGVILPVTLGVKRTFLDGLARPYVSVLSGFSFIKLGSGTGSGSINGIEKNINYQSEFKFCWQLGSGIQYRMGKVVRLDVGLNFYGTPDFSSSIGCISSYSGWCLWGGLNFILNPIK